MPTFARVLGTVLGAAVLAAAAGCGSADPAGPAPAAASSSKNSTDVLVALARCLRSHGLDVADPIAGSEQLTLPKNAPKDVSIKATQACAAYEPKTRPMVNNPARRDIDLKMAGCLRKLGIDAPDPVPGQPLVVHPHGNVERAQAAHETCEKQLGPVIPGN